MLRVFRVVIVVVTLATLLPAAAIAQGDTTPPCICCCTALDTLWPPNHELIDVGLCFRVCDNMDPNPSYVIEVFANEPDESQTGDGRFSPDAVLACDGLYLRAERDGGGCGRVYVIVIVAWDASGNQSINCCPVVVPKSMNKDKLAAVWEDAQQACAYVMSWRVPPGFVLVGIGPAIGPKLL